MNRQKDKSTEIRAVAPKHLRSRDPIPQSRRSGISRCRIRRRAKTASRRRAVRSDGIATLRLSAKTYRVCRAERITRRPAVDKVAAVHAAADIVGQKLEDELHKHSEDGLRLQAAHGRNRSALLLVQVVGVLEDEFCDVAV